MDVPLSEVEIEKNLDKLEVSKIQRQILQEKGEIMSKILEMSSLSVRGFYVLALVDWQKQVGMTVKDSESHSKTGEEQRIIEADQIFSTFRKRIARVLETKGKIHLLDKAILAARNHYLKNYINRPTD